MPMFTDRARMTRYLILLAVGAVGLAAYGRRRRRRGVLSRNGRRTP